MTVILDTNVFISGLIFPGKISKIIDHAQNSDFKLVFCDELKLEILNKFTLKFQVDLKTLQTINQLIQKGEFYQLKRVKQLLRDPKDDFVIELLRVSKADFLISADKDILEYKYSSDYIKKFENHGQYILKPFEFLEIIKS